MSGRSLYSIRRMFELISASIDAQKDELTDLDGAIGDADHGITMSLGFAAVSGELAKLDPEKTTPSDFFSVAASTFLDTVGASTGPLYASAFRKVAQVLRPVQSFSVIEQATMVEAIAAGVAERGKGQRGDKTMLDAWVPAAEAAAKAKAAGKNSSEMWTEIVAAAEAGASSTRSMVAARGRAARLGERSLGHMDPGAASAVIILLAMKDAFTDEAAR